MPTVARPSLSVAFAALPLLLLLLQGCAGTPADRSNDVAALTRQSNDWDAAIVRKDRAAIEANMADDFRQIDAAGNVDTKASFVADLVDPKLVLDPYRVEEFEVRVYGDTALLSGRVRFAGRYDGKPFDSHSRYIDVYVRRGGAWKVVSVQLSPIKP